MFIKTIRALLFIELLQGLIAFMYIHIYYSFSIIAIQLSS